MSFWPALWTVVWFVGLGIFTVLTGLTIYFGARDLKDLMRSLDAQHRSAPPDPTDLP